MNRRTFLATAATAAVASAAPVPRPKPVYDLLCVEHTWDKQGGKNRLWRVRGEAADEVMTLPNMGFFDHFTYQLHAGRYVLTRSAAVIDLRTGKRIHQPEDAILLGTDGVRVVYRVFGPKGDKSLFTFDPKAGTAEKLDPPGRWGLPGHVSPDGTRGAAIDLVGELIVTAVGGNTRPVGEHWSLHNFL